MIFVFVWLTSLKKKKKKDTNELIYKNGNRPTEVDNKLMRTKGEEVGKG